MLVRYSILAAASGSLGGVTASHGRSGQFVRARTVPTDPGSSFQSIVRTIFGNLSIAWQTLTNTQRAAWATYAENVPVRNRLGDTIRLTGHAMYIRNNAARIQAGLPRVDDGPTVFSAAVLSLVNPAPQAAGNLLNNLFTVADPWSFQAGAAVSVYSTRQSAGTVRFRKTPYRFSQVVLAPIDPPLPRNLATLSPFALDANGSNSIFLRYLVLLPDGRVSAPQETGPALIA